MDRLCEWCKSRNAKKKSSFKTQGKGLVFTWFACSTSCAMHIMDRQSEEHKHTFFTMISEKETPIA